MGQCQSASAAIIISAKKGKPMSEESDTGRPTVVPSSQFFVGSNSGAFTETGSSDADNNNSRREEHNTVALSPSSRLVNGRASSNKNPDLLRQLLDEADQTTPAINNSNGGINPRFFGKQNMREALRLSNNPILEDNDDDDDSGWFDNYLKENNNNNQNQLKSLGESVWDDSFFLRSSGKSSIGDIRASVQSSNGESSYWD